MSRKVLAITSQTGVESDELMVPLARLRQAGIEVVHAAPEHKSVQTFLHDTEKDSAVQTDTALGSVHADGYDLLLIPGGTVNVDKLRMEKTAIDLVKAFAAAGKPIAAICHAAWALIEADLVKGRDLTSYFSIQTDVRNAGGTWIDAAVVRSANGGWVLITSRSPLDLEVFSQAIIHEISPSSPPRTEQAR